MTHIIPGAAPELLYEPSFSTLADLARDVPEVTRGVDPGGVGYIGGRALTRSNIYVSRSVVALLAAERIRQGMSQSQLAEAIGLNKWNISQRETLNTPMTIYMAAEIADVLGVDLDSELHREASAA